MTILLLVCIQLSYWFINYHLFCDVHWVEIFLINHKETSELVTFIRRVIRNEFYTIGFPWTIDVFLTTDFFSQWFIVAFKNMLIKKNAARKNTSFQTSIRHHSLHHVANIVANILKSCLSIHLFLIHSSISSRFTLLFLFFFSFCCKFSNDLHIQFIILKSNKLFIDI